MDESSKVTSSFALRPLPSQLAMCDFLRRHEARAWEHFAAPATRQKLADAARLDLLKTTHRIDRASWPEWYAAAEQVGGKLGLVVAVTLYQAQSSQGLAATLARIPGEAHLVLRGPVATNLPEGEFHVLLAHELAHLLRWRSVEGELLIAENVLGALARASGPRTSYEVTARQFALGNRVACDRAALAVGDLATLIGMIARLEAARPPAAGTDAAPSTEPPSPAAFLLRAQELMRTSALTAELAPSAREAYLRAWAIDLWSKQGPDADAAIERAVAGPGALEGLDVLARQRVADTTRRILSLLLAPRWFQTAPVLDHARLYFGDFRPAERAYEDVTLADEIRAADASLRDYYCFVLLDFVAADREIQNEAVRAALHLAERLDLKDRFVELVQDELGVRKKQLDKLTDGLEPPKASA